MLRIEHISSNERTSGYSDKAILYTSFCCKLFIPTPALSRPTAGLFFTLAGDTVIVAIFNMANVAHISFFLCVVFAADDIIACILKVAPAFVAERY